MGRKKLTPDWQTEDGSIKLYCGDCLEILPQLEKGSVDAVVTDPQYGISQPGVCNDRSAMGHGKRNFDFFRNDSPDEANRLALSAQQHSMPLTSDRASAYWWCGHYTFGLLTDAYRLDGWRTRFLVWSKACVAPPFPGSGWPSGAELCVYAYRPGRIWNHDGTNYPRSNVIVADSYRHGIPGKVDHPTQKPLKVIQPLIEASSNLESVVLDPFMGSGTTGVACVRTGRKFIGIEIERKYFDIAVERIKQELRRPRSLFETFGAKPKKPKLSLLEV